MSPDDPRHGTNAGYCAGCRNACCRHGHMVWMKRYRMGVGGMVPTLGSRRRVEALEAIGWSRAEISRQLGRTREYIGHALRNEVVQQGTADAIAAIYDRLSMVVPLDAPVRRKGETRKHDATRTRAARRGFAPPLAWEDIDDPNEKPNLGGVDSEVDPVVVSRIIGHDASLARTATNAERRAVVAAWPGSLNDLERLTGWRADRYIDREEGAA